MQRFLRSEYFWTVVSVLLTVWMVIALGSNIIAVAINTPEMFFSLISPFGFSVIFDLIAPGILPGALLFGALCMRNVRRSELRHDVKDALQRFNDNH